MIFMSFSNAALKFYKSDNLTSKAINIYGRTNRQNELEMFSWNILCNNLKKLKKKYKK